MAHGTSALTGKFLECGPREAVGAGKLVLDLRHQPGKARLIAGFGASDQDVLGVKGAQQPPVVGISWRSVGDERCPGPHNSCRAPAWIGLNRP